MNISLTTDRLDLHLVNLNDLQPIHDLHCLPETDEFNTLGIPENIEQTRKILREWIKAAKTKSTPAYTFTIRNKYRGSFIGLIALKCGNPKFRIAEVWYKLHVKQWHQGFATEALTRIITFGFTELKLHRIEAGCAIANNSSVHLLQRVGFLQEGRKRKILPLKNGWSDNYWFAILEEDWVNNSATNNSR